MKIGFVGKGGSGKTTTSVLVSKYLARQGFPVVVIDADINQHMKKSLGGNDSMEIPTLGRELRKVKTYLMGTNPRIHNVEAMLKTTPPGRGSVLMRVSESNEIYDYFSRPIDGVRLMCVGELEEEDLGVRCYHSKTGSVELVLNHLIDTKNDYVIVDMTAGADAFASGLFTRFDVTFLVVEPTLKSVGVYEQYKRYAQEYGVAIRVIGNKIENSDDVKFLQKHIGDDLVAWFVQSSFVRRSDRGEDAFFEDLEPENFAALEKIKSFIDAQDKDWKKFYKQAADFHIKNAVGWGNSATGSDLTLQVDADFVADPERYF